jgi:hypothetical protein
MSEFDQLNSLKPCLIEDTESYRKVHSYTVKKLQFLESTGIQTVSEPTGLEILKVVVSGIHKSQDVTSKMLAIFNQVDCPLVDFSIDTGKINEYTTGDIEHGYRKLIQVDYRIDERIYEERKLNRVEIDDEYHIKNTFDPTECDSSGNVIPHPDFTDSSFSNVYKINEGKSSDRSL